MNKPYRPVLTVIGESLFVLLCVGLALGAAMLVASALILLLLNLLFGW